MGNSYVAPSRRPTDGRYGENPNRLGAYYQFQVLIKPSPDNIQELYLKSLEYLGLNLKEHDIRFVEDNWESPTWELGGLGLGGSGLMVWEVTQIYHTFPGKGWGEVRFVEACRLVGDNP